MDFRGVSDNFMTRPLQTEGMAKKQISTPKETSLIGTIRGLVQQKLQNVGEFFKKVVENSDCKNHILGMRHSLSNVSKLSIPSFKKIAEQFKKGAKSITDNRIVRKLKDIYDFLDKSDFNFVRKSDKPYLKEKFNSSQQKLLQRYTKFEKEQETMKPEQVLDEAIELLKYIGALSFQPDKYPIRNAMVAEVLTKYVVSQNIPDSKELPIPSFSAEGQPTVIQYILFRKINLANTGIPVFIFLPKKEEDRLHYSPLLVFRGTKFSFGKHSDIRSIVENLNKAGPARGIYDLFKKDLNQFFISWYKDKVPKPLFRVLGYSQGAVLGQRTIVDFHHYVEKGLLNASILFNSPGVEEDYQIAWEKIETENRPIAVNIIVTHDVISKRGTKFIGDVYEIEPPYSGHILDSHFGSKFITDEWGVFFIDNDNEALSESRKFVNQVMSSDIVESLYQFASKGLNKLDAISRPHHARAW